MPEDLNNTNEINEENNNSKKKKIIIIVSAAVILAAVIAAIVFAMTRNDGGYVDTPVVTEIVTDEQGEPVTDDNGEVVTQIVTTAPSGNSDSGKNSGKVTGNGSNGGNTAGGGNSGNNSANSGNSSNGGNQNSGSGNQGGSGNQSGSGSGIQGGNEDESTEPNQPVGEKRKISIAVTLPNGSGKNDTIEILVNGKVVDTHDVKLDYNSVYSFVTTAEYEGDVLVEARLKQYGTNASKTVRAGENAASIVMPLNQVEEQEGVDD